MSSIWLHEPLTCTDRLGKYGSACDSEFQWSRFYYLFGFLALVLLIVMVTCAEISIALTYFQLTSEVAGDCLIPRGAKIANDTACALKDYRWWWTAFAASGSSGLYVFLYSIMCAQEPSIILLGCRMLQLMLLP